MTLYILTLNYILHTYTKSNSTNALTLHLYELNSIIRLSIFTFMPRVIMLSIIIFSIVMLSIAMLSIAMLIIVMLSSIMLCVERRYRNAIMLSVIIRNAECHY
jgi:hypothetical protein